MHPAARAVLPARCDLSGGSAQSPLRVGSGGVAIVISDMSLEPIVQAVVAAVQ